MGDNGAVEAERGREMEKEIETERREREEWKLAMTKWREGGWEESPRGAER